MHRTLGIPYRITQPARFFVGTPGAGTVQRQADEAAVFEGLVALGLVQRGRQSQPRRLRVHTLAAVSQGIIPELALDTRLCAHGRVHQPFQAQEAYYAQDMSDHHRPDQISRGDVGTDPAIARSLKVGLQTQTVTGVVLDSANVRPLQRGCCLRRSTSNSALAARTSRRAS